MYKTELINLVEHENYFDVKQLKISGREKKIKKNLCNDKGVDLERSSYFIYTIHMSLKK